MKALLLVSLMAFSVTASALPDGDVKDYVKDNLELVERDVNEALGNEEGSRAYIDFKKFGMDCEGREADVSIVGTCIVRAKSNRIKHFYAVTVDEEGVLRSIRLSSENRD